VDLLWVLGRFDRLESVAMHALGAMKAIMVAVGPVDKADVRTDDSVVPAELLHGRSMDGLLRLLSIIGDMLMNNLPELVAVARWIVMLALTEADTVDEMMGDGTVVFSDFTRLTTMVEASQRAAGARSTASSTTASSSSQTSSSSATAAVADWRRYWRSARCWSRRAAAARREAAAVCDSH